VLVNVAAAGAMELAGARRRTGRDVATGVVLGAALGLAALFLYLSTTSTTASGTTIEVLFGSIFTVPSSLVPTIIGLGALVVVLVAALHRPLLLSSVNDDLAAARGVPVRLVGAGFLAALALAVSLAAVAIGAILSTALLVGPAAIAPRLARRPGVATALAVAIGVSATWLGIVVSYDSVSWTASGQAFPVSFCVVSIVTAAYVAVELATAGRRRVRHPSGGH
jgi:zinc/manganese transport system permease protein